MAPFGTSENATLIGAASVAGHIIVAVVGMALLSALWTYSINQSPMNDLLDL